MKSCTLRTLPERAAQVLLVILALLLPFEAPLFRVGPLQLTTVELALYTMLAAWGLAVAGRVLQAPSELAQALRQALRREGLVQAALVWAVVLFASAAAAPSNVGAGFKFALRTLSGVLAFLAVRTLARSTKVARAVVAALLAGAVVSAATACLEVVYPASDRLWGPFRAGSTFTALGLTRASGVFAYPTIGAMYWEAAVALVVASPLLWPAPAGARRPRLRSMLAIGAAMVLVWAVIGSATRSGLAGAVMACGAMLWLGWTMGTGLRRMAAGVLAVVVALSALAVVAPAPASLLSERLRFWHDDTWLRVEFALDTKPRTAFVGQPVWTLVTLRNTGTVAWSSSGNQPIRLASHWEPLGRKGTLVDFEGARTDLPEDVPPGGSVEVWGVAHAPAIEGAYRLHWDLVQEGVTWFSDLGNPTGDQRVDVTPSTGAPAQATAEHSSRPARPQPMPSRPALWRAAFVLWRAHPLLGIGPDNFRRSYEAVLSSPAAQYSDTRVHANSLYFETLADLGIAGIAALAWIAAALLRTVLGHRARADLVGLAAGVAAGAFFVHGVLDYFFEFTPLFGLFWILLGLTAACALGPEPTPAPPGTPP